MTLTMPSVRRVRLRVANVAWMEHYHGREANLVGQIVDAVELDDGDPNGVLAYVDDRDGEVGEYVDLLEGLTNLDSPVGRRAREELREHARRRFLHGTVVGVRA